MKILILIIIVNWSFAVGHQDIKSYMTVDTPESAAMYIWNETQNAKYTIEPDQKSYNLYLIDMDQKTIAEVPIPNIEFKNLKGGND